MQTLMEQESYEAPSVIKKQLAANQTIMMEIAKVIHEKKPLFAMTIGRGSSDNACNYAKYLIETQMHIVTASASPSVVTIYKQPLNLKNALVIGVSQSGKSPDICEMMQEAKKQGAITIAIVNQVDSPLSYIAEFVIPIDAGEEKAVAATKTFLGSLSAIAQLIAIATENSLLINALSKLPETLEKAAHSDWSMIAPLYKNIIQTYVIARGFSYPIAQEAALKFKEAASIHAEAFSSADLMHGPLTLIKPKHPFLLFTQQDEMLPLMVETAKKIKEMNGYAIMGVSDFMLKEYPALQKYLSVSLPLPDSIHPILDPLVNIQAFYPMIANLAVSLGKNPDAPEHLKKITETH